MKMLTFSVTDKKEVSKTKIQTGCLVRQKKCSWVDHPRLMVEIFRAIPMLALGIIFSGCASLAPPVQPDPQMAASMTLGEAKAIIERGYRWYTADGATDHSQIGVKFTPERMVLLNYWTDKTKHYVECPSFDVIDPSYVAEGTCYMTLGAHKGNNECTEIDVGICTVAVPMEMAKPVAAALLRWKNSTLVERKAYLEGGQQRFAPIAKQYRATHPPPIIPEAVRRFRIIAESAVRDNRLSDAANAYLDGLQVAPWWPDGQYNAALILAQLHYYDDAIEHMQHYLALTTQAPDARAAQDLIYQWQGEEASVQ